MLRAPYVRAPALHALPAIEHGLQTARNFGGAFVLGIHSFDKLVETYGEQGAVSLTGLARTKLILATADYRSAERCAEFIGNREVRQMDEAYRLRRVAFISEIAAIGAMTIAGLASALHVAWGAAPEFLARLQHLL